MSGDYLSRDEMLIAITDNSNKLNLNFMPQHDINIFVEFLEDFPATDAAPVVHGRWVKDERSTIPWYMCSVCGDTERISRPYCPHCGAIMDLKGE